MRRGIWKLWPIAVLCIGAVSIPTEVFSSGEAAPDFSTWQFVGVEKEPFPYRKDGIEKEYILFKHYFYVQENFGIVGKQTAFQRIRWLEGGTFEITEESLLRSMWRSENPNQKQYFLLKGGVWHRGTPGKEPMISKVPQGPWPGEEITDLHLWIRLETKLADGWTRNVVLYRAVRLP